MTARLCKDCRHIGNRRGDLVCLRTELTNTLIGMPFWSKCENERRDSHRIRFFQSNCGSRGRFWEPKQPEALHKDTVVTQTQFRWETPADVADD